MSFRTPYIMFLGDAPDELAAKTAIGVRDWRPEWCVGQMRLDGCQADLKLPDMTAAEAAAAAHAAELAALRQTTPSAAVAAL